VVPQKTALFVGGRDRNQSDSWCRIRCYGSRAKAKEHSVKVKPILPLMEHLREHLEYDAETGVFVYIKSPAKRQDLVGTVAGIPNKAGYLRISIKRKMYLCHRLAWAWVHNEEPPRSIDHIDRNKANNAISNLRDGTGSVNLMNRQFGAITGVRHYTGPKLGKNGTWRAHCRGLLYNGPDFFEACCVRKSAENRYWAANG